MKAQSLRNTGGAGDDEGDSAISDSDASDGPPVRTETPYLYVRSDSAHRFGKIYVRSKVRTLWRNFWPTRSGCSQNQAEKCLTEMAKMGDLGSESSRHSPPSYDTQPVSGS